MLLRELERFRPHLIHATGNKAALASLIPSKARRVPLIWHKVDFWYDLQGAAFLARRCRKVFAPSRACGAVVPNDRLVVIDPTLAIAPTYRAPSSRPKASVGSVGRLEPRKGHQDVIAAAGLLRESIPELKLVIAGASVPYAAGYIDSLTRMANAHGLRDGIEFLGHVQHIEQVLDRITLLVSASYRDRRGRGGEAFGLTIAEANWAGLPVVATDSGGTSEHVRHGVNGLIVRPRSPDALADAMQCILGDEARAARIGAAGAQLAHERFDPERTAARLFAELRACA
jgi:glycosyltransferase involved in cell wall biosynthesis